MLHLQGNLQLVFDALYEMGVIEPVLNKDWKGGLLEIERGSPGLRKAIRIVNACGSDMRLLVSELEQLDRQSLEVLAMEVAREYADFHTRQELH